MTMKKIRIIIYVIFFGVILLNLSGCQNNIENDEPYKVTFVDYEGNVLKEINCDGVGECDITPPQSPEDIGQRYFTRWSVFESDFDEINKDTVIKPIYTLDNRLVTIFGRSIYFYSFFIMTGIFVALGLGLRETKRTGVKKDDLIDGFLWIVPISIIGARLWYVIFELDQFVGGGFFPSLLRMIGFSSGTLDFSTFGLSGLAIHGAFVTALICTYFYTRKRKIDIYKVFDIIAVGFIIAQAFGRWGNFFNQEAHGGIVGGAVNGTMNLSVDQQFNYLRYTLHIPEFIVNNMYIQEGLHSYAVEPFTGYYHPTFFYESTLNILGFVVMLVLRRYKKIHFGELLAFYLVWYGGVRIFIETMRTDPLVFEIFGMTLKSAIVTSTLMILAGIGLSVYIRIRRKGMDYSTVDGSWF
ncbi:MAG: prolipoprotein diacylglyceryl transferase [Tenericutes bacterium HGW-Tenericutes-5]|jgi:phosphatidylglycerol:prolipoprotein diacylglycerol transferase|nr:MAG: prolipoprotein diacylglyceryl transferase [Tenericutes bacterium HGW-Tenericutes-5]